jgi:hypothetical protein
VLSLRGLYEGDSHLMDVDVGERTLAGAFARHLALQVAEWPEQWSVDIEYNRMSVDRHDGAAYKYLIDVLGEPIRPAYPDLIVHRRGIDGADGGNLMVIEVKRRPSDTERAQDHAKLVAWCRELWYQYGARLELGAGEPLCAWVTADDDQHRPTPAKRVF